MVIEDSKLIAEISTNVLYLRQSFDEHKLAFKEHVAHDDKVAQEYLKPLWESHQQSKGAAHLAVLLYGALGSAITLVGGYFSGVLHK